MDRAATAEAIWTFAGFPAGYGSLLEASQHPLSGEVLLSLARLTEWPERYTAAWGEAWYRRILAWHRWPTYQALGKLEGRLWVLRARPTRPGPHAVLGGYGRLREPREGPPPTRTGGPRRRYLSV